jgi:hypothetical protein
MMAVHNNKGSALPLGWSGLALGGSVLSLRKLALVLGKGHAVHATTNFLLSLSLGVGLLATLGGALLLVGIIDSEISDKKKSKAGQT